jgi:hypothetical protein
VSATAAQPSKRLVILGASNVARGIATIADVAREILGGPVEILAAMGHGRSYGLTTSIPLRTLPSMLSSGLWQALAERPPLPTFTLLTDIGNDLIYGCLPGEVRDWVAESAERLQPHSKRLAFTALPLASVTTVGKLRFLAFRRAFFPQSTLPHDDARRYAVELDQLVTELANERGAQLLAPERAWYGFDPIHIRIALQRAAWRQILRALFASTDDALGCEQRSSLRDWVQIMRIRPERSVVALRDRFVPQPDVVLRDGTSISFY